MFGSMRGSWGVTSEKDPRWNGGGGTDIAGIFCPDIQRHIDRTKELLKEDPPDDLRVWSYKD